MNLILQISNYLAERINISSPIKNEDFQKEAKLRRQVMISLQLRCRKLLNKKLLKKRWITYLRYQNLIRRVLKKQIYLYHQIRILERKPSNNQKNVSKYTQVISINHLTIIQEIIIVKNTVDIKILLMLMSIFEFRMSILLMI